METWKEIFALERPPETPRQQIMGNLRRELGDIRRGSRETLAEIGARNIELKASNEMLLGDFTALLRAPSKSVSVPITPGRLEQSDIGTISFADILPKLDLDYGNTISDLVSASDQNKANRSSKAWWSWCTKETTWA